MKNIGRNQTMKQYELLIEITNTLRKKAGENSVISQETYNLAVGLANSFINDQEIIRENAPLILKTEGSNEAMIFKNFKDFKTWYEDNFSIDLTEETLGGINSEFEYMHDTLEDVLRTLEYKVI